jgi:peptidoglycan/LPS O-acetylase OafA/YrhL
VELQPSKWLLGIWSQPATLKNFAAESTLVFVRDHPIIPQAWTLSIELLISLLIPMFVLVASRSSWWLLAMTAAASAFLNTNLFVVHFALGVVLARHYWEWRHRLEGSVAIRVAVLLGGLTLYTFGFSFALLLHLHHEGRGTWVATGAGSAMLLLYVSSAPRVRAMLSLRWVRHLGAISYSIYLSHFAVLLCLAPRVLAEAQRFGFGRHVAWAIGLIATILVTLAVSSILYRLVEIPSISLGRTVNARISSWQARQPALFKPLTRLDRRVRGR